MRSRLQVLALFLCAMCGACAPRVVTPGPGVPMSPQPPASDGVVQVRISQATEGNAWDVEYRFPAPATAVRFARPGHGFRQSHWQVLEPAGAALRAEEDTDVLGGAAAPFQALRLRVSTYTEQPEKDYQVFIPYSSGGWLLYSGVFSVERPGDGSPWAHRFTFVPRPGEHAVAGGRMGEDQVEWEGPLDGTYAYFGKDPVVQGALAAVVDTGFPAWLRIRTEELIPKVFAHYTQRTGKPLTSTPTLFVTYGPNPGAGSINMKGGALQGVIQLDIRLGSDLQTIQSPEVEANILQLLAHESAHLWNAQLVHHEVQGGDWMHEGGAEAFTLSALRQMGALPEAYVRRRLSDAVSECLFNLEGRPLTESSRPGRYTNYYRCGLVIEALAEASARAQQPATDVFTLWGGLFRKVGPEAKYDEEALLQSFAEGGVSERTLGVIRRIIHGPTEGLGGPLLEELARLGFAPVSDDAGAPKEFQQLVGWRALRLALRTECGEVVPVSSPEGLRMQGATCATLDAIGGLRTLAGFDPRLQGTQAYDAARRACSQAGKVEVAGGKAARPVPIPCGPGAMPERVPYVSLGRIP